MSHFSFHLLKAAFLIFLGVQAAMADEVGWKFKFLSPSLNYQQQAATGKTNCADGWPGPGPCPSIRHAKPYRQPEWFFAPGVGIHAERESQFGSGVDVASVRVLRDSFNRLSLMGGVGRQWEIHDAGQWFVRGGFSAGLWGRTVQVAEDFFPADGGGTQTIPRTQGKLVAFFAPTIEIKSGKNDIGMLITLFPQIGAEVVSPTLMFELTKKF